MLKLIISICYYIHISRLKYFNVKLNFDNNLSHMGNLRMPLTLKKCKN